MEILDVNGPEEQSGSRYDYTATALLCYFLGIFGVHRFYTGQVGTGIIMLLTVGGFGIWALVDMIMLFTGSFRDGDGYFVWPVSR